jgi:hypothetical protein
VLGGVAAVVVIGFVVLTAATSDDEGPKAKPEPGPIQTSSSLKRPAAEPQAKRETATPAKKPAAAKAGPTPSASGSPQTQDSETTDAGPEPAVDGPVKVKVTTEPHTAIVFRRGKRIGEGEVTVEVPKGDKVSLVVLHRGYNYRRIRLDGSKPEVTVRLLKIPEEVDEEE